MMDFSWIHIFVTVVEQGGFAAAARNVRLSPAAVSKQIAKLEATVGVQLLERSTRHVTLSEAGRLFYHQCKKILEEVEEAQSLASQMRAEPQGRLRVVSGRHFAAAYIVPVLAEFMELYPKIVLDLELAERIPDMDKEKVDVLIGMNLSATGDVIQRSILTTRYSFCASPEYFQAYGTPRKPKDLLHHRYITHSMRRPDDLVEFSQGERLTLCPFLKINDAETLRTLACHGMGIIMVHHYVVKKDLEEGRLKECLRDYTLDRLPIRVAYPQQRYLPPKTRCFIDFVVSKIKTNQ